MDIMFIEKWEKRRWRTDSIYLQKYHDLVVPKERQEEYKGQHFKIYRKNNVSKLYNDQHKRGDVR